jgi:hypothetical protein
VLAGTEVSRILSRVGKADCQELHRRIAALENALKQATSPSHPLLGSPSGRSIVKTDDDHAPASSTPSRSYNVGSMDAGPSSAGSEATDRLSAYSHLVMEDDPGRSRYYGAASSVYLAVSLALSVGGYSLIFPEKKQHAPPIHF